MSWQNVLSFLPPPGDESKTFLNAHSPCWALLWVSHSGRVSEYQLTFIHSHIVSEKSDPFLFLWHWIFTTFSPSFLFQSWKRRLHERFTSDSNRQRLWGERFRLEEELWNRSVNELSKDATEPAQQNNNRPLLYYSIFFTLLFVGMKSKGWKYFVFNTFLWYWLVWGLTQDTFEYSLFVPKQQKGHLRSSLCSFYAKLIYNEDVR